MPIQGVDVLTEQTKEFIDENPTDLATVRNTRTPDGSGGYTTSPTDVPAQRVRLVNQARGVSTERRSASGAVVTPDIVVVGMPDLDMQRGDTFTHEGVKMEVVWVTRLLYVTHVEVAMF